MLGSTSKTIQQLAGSWGRSTKEVGAALRKVDPKVPTGQARDPNHLLSVAQWRRVAVELGVPVEDQEDPPEAEVELPLVLSPDPMVPTLDLGLLHYPLWLASGVADMAQRLGLTARLSIVLQHLASSGTTAVVKGCHGQTNQGWLRSPMGGNGGFQFYLWWAPEGHPPVQRLSLPAQGIVVQAVRHHDDHRPLPASEAGDYYVFERPHEVTELVDAPWTREQLEFVQSEDPVRVVVGQPGSGKTTVLWNAIEARAGQEVLYVTWSDALTRLARRRFEAFAPRTTRVTAQHFLALLAELGDEDVPYQPLAVSRAAFVEAVRPLGSVLGAWAARPEALFAEVRAHVVGRTRADGDSVTHDGLWRLTDEAYEKARKRALGAAVYPVVQVVKALERGGKLAPIFPELVAAGRAIERLRLGHLPSRYAGVDRLVVDEVQDLTQLEATVVIELCRAIARVQGKAPWLLVAGDEGQTVRPSGFEWAALKDHLGRRVAVPREYKLEDNLRCPAGVDEVIQRASETYQDLLRTNRPAKLSRRGQGQPLQAALVHCVLEDVDRAVALVEALSQQLRVKVLAPTDQRPAWLPAELADGVFGPAEIKGLEYQTVVVLDPGAAMLGLRGAGAGLQQSYVEHERRTRIDQLRVAFSRATESLVFLDVKPDSQARAESRRLLGPDAMQVDELLELLAEGDTTPEERVTARLAEAQVLLEERPDRAWRRLHQALVMLGEPGAAHAVGGKTLRGRTCGAVLAAAARLRLGVPMGVRPEELDDAASRALAEVGTEAERAAYDALREWGEDRRRPALALLGAAAAAGPVEWLPAALEPVYRTLQQSLESAASNPATSLEFRGDVEAWLRIAGWTEDAAPEVERLRRLAFEALLTDRKLLEAGQMLELFTDLHALGRLREAEGRFVEAAESYQAVPSPVDARRAWRAAGRWERARPFAQVGSEEERDLHWLERFAELVRQRPGGQHHRLSAKERERLREVLAEVT